MRASTVLLVGPTLGFAITCAYLAHQLAVERERTAAESVRSHQPEARVHDTERVLSTTRERGTTSTSTVSDPSRRAEQQELRTQKSANAKSAAGESSDPDYDRARRAQAQWRDRFLKSLQDPAGRALLLAQQKIQARRENPELAKALHLTADEEEHLLELLAEQHLKLMEMAFRHSPDAGADAKSAYAQLENELYQQRQDALANLLGPEKYQQYQSYQSEVPERAQVMALRARLDQGNALSDEQAARLIAAMRKERDNFVSQIPRDDHMFYEAAYPFFAQTLDPDPAKQLSFAENQLAATEAFLGPIHDGAAEVLTAEQLKRFEELQEEQLTRSRARVQSLRESATQSTQP